MAKGIEIANSDISEWHQSINVQRGAVVRKEEGVLDKVTTNNTSVLSLGLPDMSC